MTLPPPDCYCVDSMNRVREVEGRNIMDAYTASMLVHMEQEAMARAKAQEEWMLRDDLIDDEDIGLTHTAESGLSRQRGDLLSSWGEVLVSLRTRLKHPGVQER